MKALQLTKKKHQKNSKMDRMYKIIITGVSIILLFECICFSFINGQFATIFYKTMFSKYELIFNIVCALIVLPYSSYKLFFKREKSWVYYLGILVSALFLFLLIFAIKKEE